MLLFHSFSRSSLQENSFQINALEEEMATQCFGFHNWPQANQRFDFETCSIVVLKFSHLWHTGRLPQRWIWCAAFDNLHSTTSQSAALTVESTFCNRVSFATPAPPWLWLNSRHNIARPFKRATLQQMCSYTLGSVSHEPSAIGSATFPPKGSTTHQEHQTVRKSTCATTLVIQEFQRSLTLIASLSSLRSLINSSLSFSAALRAHNLLFVKFHDLFQSNLLFFSSRSHSQSPYHCFTSSHTCKYMSRNVSQGTLLIIHHRFSTHSSLFR